MLNSKYILQKIVETLLSLIVLDFLFLFLLFCVFSISLSHKGKGSAYTPVDFFSNRAWFLNEKYSIQFKGA